MSFLLIMTTNRNYLCLLIFHSEFKEYLNQGLMSAETKSSDFENPECHRKIELTPRDFVPDKLLLTFDFDRLIDYVNSQSNLSR